VVLVRVVGVVGGGGGVGGGGLWGDGLCRS